MRVASVATAVVALLAAAWFALGIRQANDSIHVQSALSAGRPIDAAQARRLNALLDSAAELNPDQEVQVLRGRLQLRRGERAQALQTFQRVTAAEPRSREAWLWVAQAAGGNGVLLKDVLQHVFALDPPPWQRH